MKIAIIGIMLFIWMIFTLMFVCSLVGLVLIVHNDNSGERTGWIEIGIDLKDGLIK